MAALTLQKSHFDMTLASSGERVETRGALALPGGTEVCRQHARYPLERIKRGDRVGARRDVFLPSCLGLVVIYLLV